MKKKIPLIMQMRRSDNGMAALSMMVGYYGRYISLSEMRDICFVTRNNSSSSQICEAAKRLQINAKVKTVSYEEVFREQLPCMIGWKKNNYAILVKVKKKSVILYDPASGKVEILKEKFEKSFGKKVFELIPEEGFVTGGRTPSTYGLVFQRLKRYKNSVFFLGLIMAAASLLGTVMVSKRKNLMDRYMEGQDYHLFWLSVMIFVGVWLIQVLLNIGSTMYQNEISGRQSARSSEEIYKKILYMPSRFFEKVSRGEIISRVEDSNQLDQNIVSTFAPKLLTVCSMFFYSYLIFSLNYS